MINQSTRKNTITESHPTELGIKQASNAGERLVDLLDPTDKVLFYTSPYKRTVQTTEGLWSRWKNTIFHTEYTPNRGCENRISVTSKDLLPRWARYGKKEHITGITLIAFPMVSLEQMFMNELQDLMIRCFASLVPTSFHQYWFWFRMEFGAARFWQSGLDGVMKSLGIWDIVSFWWWNRNRIRTIMGCWRRCGLGTIHQMLLLCCRVWSVMSRTRVLKVLNLENYGRETRFQLGSRKRKMNGPGKRLKRPKSRRLIVECETVLERNLRKYKGSGRNITRMF